MDLALEVLCATHKVMQLTQNVKMGSSQMAKLIPIDLPSFFREHQERTTCLPQGNAHTWRTPCHHASSVPKDCSVFLSASEKVAK